MVNLAQGDPIDPGEEGLAVHVLGQLGEELGEQHEVGLLQQLLLVEAEQAEGSSEEEIFAVPENKTQCVKTRNISTTQYFITFKEWCDTLTMNISPTQYFPTLKEC